MTDAPSPRCLTLVQYAREIGGTTTADVDGHIHAGLRSMPTTKTYARWNTRRLAELSDARDATVAAYRAAIAGGEIREPTVDERLRATAAGHPDNEATRAAQRVLEKRAARTRGEAGHRPPPDEATRGHLAVQEENGGYIPWCGPTALALATGLSYGDACELLRRTDPPWYPSEGPIVTAYWRDILAGMGSVGVPYEPVALPRRWSLLAILRAHLLDPGWYILRITNHFLLLRVFDDGSSVMYDNKHTAAPMSRKTYGRCQVTHAARLTNGPAPGSGMSCGCSG